MMRDAIFNFPKQFDFRPTVLHASKLKKTKKFVVCGMGGSHLAADLLLTWNPSLDLLVHRDYGLATVPDLRERLTILSSYSGNTEEVISGFREGLKKKLPLAALSIGATLETMAMKYRVPFVKMPDTGIQPRSALGFSMVGLLALMRRSQGLRDARELSITLKPADLEADGRRLAKTFRNRIPVIYASRRNEAIAYNWKIKLNETGKIPAFYSVFPELNHNEMTGFDVKKSSRHLSRGLFFILLTDTDDEPRIEKRMRIVARLYAERGLPVEMVALHGRNRLEKMFRSLIIADWTALHTAMLYGLESEQVPMVEEFKLLISRGTRHISRDTKK